MRAVTVVGSENPGGRCWLGSRGERPHQHGLADAAAPEVVHGPDVVGAGDDRAVGLEERLARQVVTQQGAVAALAIEQREPPHRALVQGGGLARHDFGHALQGLDPQPRLVGSGLRKSGVQLVLEGVAQRGQGARGMRGDHSPAPGGARHVPVVRLGEHAAGDVTREPGEPFATDVGDDAPKPRRARFPRHPEEVLRGLHLPALVDGERRVGRVDQPFGAPGLEHGVVFVVSPGGHLAAGGEHGRPRRHQPQPARRLRRGGHRSAGQRLEGEFGPRLGEKLISARQRGGLGVHASVLQRLENLLVVGFHDHARLLAGTEGDTQPRRRALEL